MYCTHLINTVWQFHHFPSFHKIRCSHSEERGASTESSLIWPYRMTAHVRLKDRQGSFYHALTQLQVIPHRSAPRFDSVSNIYFSPFWNRSYHLSTFCILAIRLSPPARSRCQLNRHSFSLLSHLMTKPKTRLCAQRRLGSAWASAQSDQSLCCALIE